MGGIEIITHDSHASALPLKLPTGAYRCPTTANLFATNSAMAEFVARAYVIRPAPTGLHQPEPKALAGSIYPPPQKKQTSNLAPSQVAD